MNQAEIPSSSRENSRYGEGVYRKLAIALRGLDANWAAQALPELERYIIEQRFSLTGDTPKTLQSIGETIGLSRERVRQLQNRALYRLRGIRDQYRPERAMTKVQDKENGEYVWLDISQESPEERYARIWKGIT